jgi:polyphenol oxidase
VSLIDYAYPAAARRLLNSGNSMSDEILTAHNLNALPRVRHAFFTRVWGNNCFSEVQTGHDFVQVRERMAGHLGISAERFLCCRQVHSPTVITVGDVWKSQNAPAADAMVTDKPGIALGILTADCAPILLASSDIPAIGAAHAGWRGAVGGVLEQVLDAMEKIGAQRKFIHAALGPCIGQKSYEVGPEFPAPFLAQNPGHEQFFKPSIKKGSYLFDLQGYILEKLQRLGVGSIDYISANTYADPDRFFSHRYSTLRGEKREGSLVSAISLA